MVVKSAKGIGNVEAVMMRVNVLVEIVIGVEGAMKKVLICVKNDHAKKHPADGQKIPVGKVGGAVDKGGETNEDLGTKDLVEAEKLDDTGHPAGIARNGNDVVANVDGGAVVDDEQANDGLKDLLQNDAAHDLADGDFVFDVLFGIMNAVAFEEGYFEDGNEMKKKGNRPSKER